MAYIEEHNWIPLMNVANESDDNPIEYFFAYVKNMYRKLLVESSSRDGFKDYDLQLLVHKTMATFHNFKASKVINKCIK